MFSLSETPLLFIDNKEFSLILDVSQEKHSLEINIIKKAICKKILILMAFLTIAFFMLAFFPTLNIALYYITR